jgi:hypothetical protein
MGYMGTIAELAPSRMQSMFRRLNRQASAKFDEHPQTGQALLRSFSFDDFLPDASWSRLEVLLNKGGSYGLAGPRGAGKTWLMRYAIATAEKRKGLGLFFPCPSEYNANAFLSALSENLASEVQRCLRKRTILDSAVTAAWSLAAAVLTVVLIVLVITRVLLHNTSTGVTVRSLITVPHALRYAAGGALIVFAAFVALSLRTGQRRRRQLARAATAMRQRIRFSSSLMLASETGISSGRILTAVLRHTSRRSLDERPLTKASLVFDFRNFVALAAEAFKGPIVIGIDELDKMDDPIELRDLLRNIKGILDVGQVTYHVSVSDEAAGHLQLGSLKSERNEFNSSLYQVIYLAPLSQGETMSLFDRRKIQVATELAGALCLLSGGNRRELLRMADSCRYITHNPEIIGQPDEAQSLVLDLLCGESTALLEDIMRNPVDPPTGDAHGAPGSDSRKAKEAASRATEAKYRAMNALPKEWFRNVTAFIKLGDRSLYDEYWNPAWTSPEWARVQDPWRRLLVRIFIASRICTDKSLLSEATVTDLRNVIIMSTLDPDVARQMLFDRFGKDQLHPYQPQKRSD